jgi:hypothetical protein
MRCLTRSLLMLLIALSPGVASAQMGTVSVYNDVDVDHWGNGDFVVLGWGNVEDYPPSGCDHFDYYTTSIVGSPTGRSSSTQSSGTGSGAALSINEEGGSWSIDLEGYASCTCGGPQSQYYGGGLSAPVDIAVSYYKNPTWNGLACTYASWNCTSGSPSCGGVPHVMAHNGSSCPATIKASSATVYVWGAWHCTPSFDQDAGGAGGTCS